MGAVQADCMLCSYNNKAQHNVTHAGSPGDVMCEAQLSHHAADVVLDARRCEQQLAQGSAVRLLIRHANAGKLHGAREGWYRCLRTGHSTSRTRCWAQLQKRSVARGSSDQIPGTDSPGLSTDVSTMLSHIITLSRRLTR